MEAIVMKCTREQYESMREELLNAKVKESSCLFDFYGDKNVYLTNDCEGELFFTCVILDRKVYETFDKAIFLKACGIDPNKVLFDQLWEYFKDAVQCVSVMESEFNMKDYDLNSLHIDNGCVFIKNNNGEQDKLIYDLETKEYAKIVNTTIKPIASLNTSKDLLEHAKWAGGSSITPEMLRELTEPKNEAKRLKVGGIYKSKQTKELLPSLIKITKDNGKKIYGYGFLDGKYFKDRICYGEDCREEAISRQIKVSQKKWEKALLKYKK